MSIRNLIIPRRFDGFALIIAAVALFGAALVLYRQTAYGASATADSARQGRRPSPERALEITLL